MSLAHDCRVQSFLLTTKRAENLRLESGYERHCEASVWDNRGS